MVVGSRPPEGAYDQLGAITATHGGGCGLYGTGGNYEGAYTIVRNRALELAANYVQILKITEPQYKGICYHRGYVIDAMAYRVHPGSASTAPVPQATNAPPNVGVALGGGLNGTFAGQVSGIQGDRQFSMGVSFTIVQTENKIAGAWTATGGTSGTVTATVKGGCARRRTREADQPV